MRIKDNPRFIDEIVEMRGIDIPLLLEDMPADAFHSAEFTQDDQLWTFDFCFNSVRARFAATATGKSPREAFLAAKEILAEQLHQWRLIRFTGLAPIGEALKAWSPDRRPRALIVDDDPEVALAVAAAFDQFDCETQVITSTENLHREIGAAEADFVILDWRLGEELVAAQVVEKASRVIDAFSDLRDKFARRRPKVITYSVLGRSEIQFPETVYFDHIDHWQKPITFSELKERTNELLFNNGF